MAGYVTPQGNLSSGGSQGFPGFAPGDAVKASRNSQSAYIDIDAKPFDGLDIDAAGRFENYSDFGTTVNGKIAARYDFNDMFAIRGAISSGFRGAVVAAGIYQLHLHHLHRRRGHQQRRFAGLQPDRQR